MIDELGHEKEQDVPHAMEEIFQEQRILHIEVDAGTYKLHKVEQLQEVTIFGNNIEYNGHKKPGSHDQWQVAGQSIGGAFLIIFIVVKVVDDLLIEVDADGLVGLLGVEVWDRDVGGGKTYFLVVIHEFQLELCEFV